MRARYLLALHVGFGPLRALQQRVQRQAVLGGDGRAVVAQCARRHPRLVLAGASDGVGGLVEHVVHLLHVHAGAGAELLLQVAAVAQGALRHGVLLLVAHRHELVAAVGRGRAAPAHWTVDAAVDLAVDPAGLREHVPVLVRRGRQISARPLLRSQHAGRRAVHIQFQQTADMAVLVAGVARAVCGLGPQEVVDGLKRVELVVLVGGPLHAVLVGSNGKR